MEPDRRLPDAATNDVFHTDERPTADEENLRGVHLDVLLFGMLTTALRRNVRHRAFEHFQQRLLNALARHVPRDTHVLRRPADLVDFVDVDDAALRRLAVVVGRRIGNFDGE